MKVKDLILILQKMPQESHILLESRENDWISQDVTVIFNAYDNSVYLCGDADDVEDD